MANTKSNPPPPRKEIAEFASMMEARLQEENNRGIETDTDQDALLTKLYNLVHDLKSGLVRERNVAPCVSSLAIVAMKIAQTRGELSSMAARRNSMYLIDPAQDTIRDTSTRFAVLHKNKCTLWGATIISDVELTTETLQSALGAIQCAMATLHTYSVRAGRVIIESGVVYALPDEGVEDPRSPDERSGHPISSKL